MTERRKPKLLIIGHARHGKDTLAEMITERMGLKFTSSSHFVGQECIWPSWGKERYETYEDMFQDRVNYRKTWADLISAYNTPDKTRTASTMLERGYDMYVGMRRMDEFVACKEAKLFDFVIWVDASKRLPPESLDSNEMVEELSDFWCDNNGPDTTQMQAFVERLQKKLYDEGFEVGYQEFEPVPEKEIGWEEMPEGAIQVLDHGFFIVRGIFGNDKEIADAARMSYGRGTKKVNADEGLINYLVQNHHTSPLEMGEVKVHMRLPIFVMRQLVRHRTANLNEYSGRYSEMVRLFYVPEPAQICSQDKINKQGSAEPLDPHVAKLVQEAITDISNEAFDTYEMLLERKVSRETARMVLPLNTYTEVVWKMDVSNLIKFLMLRDDSHAQYEIRVYAKLLAEALGHFFPAVYAAYEREKSRISLNLQQIEAILNRSTEGLPKGEAKVVQDIFDKLGAVWTP